MLYPFQDLPSEEMGVGTREMGYLFGQYRRLAGHFQVLKTPVTSLFLKYTIYSFFLVVFLIFLKYNMHHLLIKKNYNLHHLTEPLL